MNQQIGCIVYKDANLEPHFFQDGPNGSLIAISNNGSVVEFMWNPSENKIENSQAFTKSGIKKIQAACYNPWHNSLIYTELGTKNITSVNLASGERMPLSDWPIVPLSISMDDSLRYYASDGKTIVLLDADDGAFLQKLLRTKGLGGIWDVTWCRTQPHILIQHGFGYRQISYYSVQTYMSD